MKKLLFVALLLSVPAVAYAQTPDGETPANEGVCDELIGLTPGLYGLCVAFCEAQDCIATFDPATFDPATDDVAFDPSCSPSSPKILANYNRRLNPGDPPMPCINVADNECPCWTEAELNLIADGVTSSCRAEPGQGPYYYAYIQGSDALTGLEEEVLVMKGGCYFLEKSPPTTRLLLVSAEEGAACVESVSAECADRGF